MITLELTTGEMLFVKHLLDQQSGSYAELKRVWRLEDKLCISDEVKKDVGWTEEEINGRKITTVKDENHVLIFELEDQDAKTLQNLFTSFPSWPKRPEVRTLGSKLMSMDPG